MKYLFQVIFNDGQQVRQTQDDVSSIDPTKSTMFDVLQRIDDVVSFCLYEADGTLAVNVDLERGLITVGDGIPFQQADDHTLPLRLIYYRNVLAQVTPGIGSSHEILDYVVGYEWIASDGTKHCKTVTVT